MKYRSRMDIASEILEIAEGGALKTRIMYSAFLSFPQLNDYLDVLVESGLLEYFNDEKEYMTTDKGRHFIKKYKETADMLYPRGSKIKAALSR